MATHGLRAALAAPLTALRRTARSPGLARTQGAFALLNVATWIYTVTMTVYAFRAGGAAAVGVAVIVRTLPSAAAGPLVGALADRRSRSGVMLGASLLAAVALGLSALLVAIDGPREPVFALGLAVSVCTMAFRSAQSAILPALTDDPRDLASSNVVSSTIESAAVFAGPVAAAGLLVVGGPELAFAVAALLAVGAALTGVGLRDAPPALAASGAAAPGDDGLRGAIGDPVVRLVLGLLLAQTFVSGALTVFYALCAIELLDLGDAGVGLLTAAFGAGGVLGSVAAFSLTGVRRIVALMVAGMLLWGLPLSLVGVTAATAPALLLLALIGAGNVLFDVTTVTILQRGVPDGVLARVFGVLETVVVVGLGLGAVVAAPLADVLGLRGALIAVGLVLPLIALLTRGALRRADSGLRLPVERVEVLRRLPIFAPLPGIVLEGLAFGATAITVPAGTVVMAEGEPGDRFYAMVAGRVRVDEGGLDRGVREPGDGFGEIALLHDGPRTATVTAVDDLELLAIDRAPFLAAVTGHAGALDGANAIVAARLGTLARRPRA